MPFISHDPLQQVSGVAANSTFTVTVPLGYTYHSFEFILGGTTFNLSHITNLKLWINGKVQQLIRSATELDNINKFDRLAAYANNLLRWPLGRIGLDLVEGRERTLLGTGISEAVRATLQDPKNPNYDPVEVTSVQITGDIGAATAPTLQVFARRSAPRPTGVLKQVRNFVRNPSGAGDFEISDLPKDGVLNRVIFKTSANNITNVKLKINNIEVFSRTPTVNTRIQADGIRTAQASYFGYDPAEDGASNNSPPFGPKDDVRWIITVDGAMTLDIQYETLDFLG